MVPRTESDLLQSLRGISRDIYNIKRRIGSPLPPVEETIAVVSGIGSGPFVYDYLIDKNWATIVAAGGGSEGETFTTFHGHTFKVYSTIEAAVSDANTNRQTVLQSTSFFIVGTGVGTSIYQVATTISLDPPSAGSYHLYGSGADTVTIEGMMSSGILFDIPTQSLDSLVEFHHIEIKTSQPITLIQGGGSTRIALDNCWLRPNHSGATAISPGNSGVGWNISNTNIEGSGFGIAAIGISLMGIRLTNCYIAVSTGIQMTNDAQVYLSNVRFQCSVADVAIGATSGALAFAASNCEFNNGIIFNSGASLCFFESFIVNGCIFILSGSETGINYAGATGTNTLLACRSHSIVGNAFWTTSASAVGIRGGSVTANGPKQVAIVGNSFKIGR